MRTPLLAAAAAAALLLAGCSTSIDTDKAASEISQGITAQTGLENTVECPDGVAVEAGATFTCTATFSDGSTAPVLVTQEDDEGNLTWELNPDS